MATLPFELVAPERILYSGEVDAVVLPATDGDITVMPGHAPVMTTLKAGFLVISDHKGHGQRVLVRGGFADVNPSGLTVLAQRALPVEELTPDMLEREILHAEMAYDATNDQQKKHAAQEVIGQLREARAALNL